MRLQDIYWGTCIWLTYWISVEEQNRSFQDGLKHPVVQSLGSLHKNVEDQQGSCDAKKDGNGS